jgi:hypothetical protein
MKQIAIYSPIQVFAGAFLGGPIAAVYPLWKNFQALGKDSLARQTIIWGSVLVLAIVASLPFLPENLPNAILPAIFGGVAMVIASQFQLKKQEIQESNEYGFASFWRVAAVVVLSLIAVFVLIIAFLLILWALGLMKLG